jgi:hypothetical protein
MPGYNIDAGEVNFNKNKGSNQLTKIIKVENPISVSRKNETIALSYKLLKKEFKKADIKFLQIKDIKQDKILLTQAIDYNQDGIIDEFLFQSDFNSKETKKFSISLSENNAPDSSLVYAAFISKPEGLGDFAWENDYIGYRMYGQARADAQGTGTAIDVWCKRLPDRLTDKWYTPGQSYHVDKGYGADHYASGKNQGCGGSGVYYNDQVYFSKSYSSWKIMANGPIRVVFELEFTGWQFENNDIKEVKRITLDAGQYFNQIESTYKLSDSTFAFSHAVGIVQRTDSESFIEKKEGWFGSWESLGENNGYLGCGFIAPVSIIIDIKNLNNHLFGLLVSKPGESIRYYTGAAWNEFGPVKSFEIWKTYIENKVQCINNKCIVSIRK